MPWSKVVTFTDPFPCQAALQSTSQAELLPTARGSFRVDATQIGMDKLRMQRFEVALPQISTVMVAPDREAIGFLIEGNSSNLQHRGLEVLPNDILVYGYDVLHQRSVAQLSVRDNVSAKGGFSCLVQNAHWSRIFRKLPDLEASSRSRSHDATANASQGCGTACPRHARCIGTTGGAVVTGGAANLSHGAVPRRRRWRADRRAVPIATTQSWHGSRNF